jgi:two-component system NtrC family sensor kinase
VGDQKGHFDAFDKHAVLQVLVNLVKNAKEALRDGGAPDKTLTVRIAPAERGCVQIEIADNGVGIAPEIAARIWEHAFTTKRSGNGFGLHNSALAAQAIGGSLRVHSDGPGRGASFAFTIPITTRELTHA